MRKIRLLPANGPELTLWYLAIEAYDDPYLKAYAHPILVWMTVMPWAWLLMGTWVSIGILNT